jgi:hypothetical protein
MPIVNGSNWSAGGGRSHISTTGNSLVAPVTVAGSRPSKFQIGGEPNNSKGADQNTVGDLPS